MAGMKKMRGLGLVAVSMLLASPLVACKKAPEGGRAGKRTVKAAIAEFDPNGDIELDLDKYGGDRVDEWEVQQAFNRSFDALDKCVAQTKSKLKMSSEKQLEGDVDFAVKLNPESKRPFAVNASLSSPVLAKNEGLRDCMREAVAGVGFPTYNGPPQVAEFSTQVDPGMSEEEDY